jgi:hypothetical protein
LLQACLASTSGNGGLCGGGLLGKFFDHRHRVINGWGTGETNNPSGSRVGVATGAEDRDCVQAESSMSLNKDRNRQQTALFFTHGFSSFI